MIPHLYNLPPTASNEPPPIAPPAPPRPVNLYIRFSRSIYDTVASSNPSLPLAEVGRQIGERWKNLPAHEKQVYQDEYDKDMQSYRLAMEEYERSDQYREYLRERVEQRRRHSAMLHGTSKVLPLDGFGRPLSNNNAPVTALLGTASPSARIETTIPFHNQGWPTQFGHRDLVIPRSNPTINFAMPRAGTSNNDQLPTKCNICQCMLPNHDDALCHDCTARLSIGDDAMGHFTVPTAVGDVQSPPARAGGATVDTSVPIAATSVSSDPGAEIRNHATSAAAAVQIKCNWCGDIRTTRAAARRHFRVAHLGVAKGKPGIGLPLHDSFERHLLEIRVDNTQQSSVASDRQSPSTSPTAQDGGDGALDYQSTVFVISAEDDQEEGSSPVASPDTASDGVTIQLDSYADDADVTSVKTVRRRLRNKTECLDCGRVLSTLATARRHYRQVHLGHPRSAPGKYALLDECYENRLVDLGKYGGGTQSPDTRCDAVSQSTTPAEIDSVPKVVSLAERPHRCCDCNAVFNTLGVARRHYRGVHLEWHYRDMDPPHFSMDEATEAGVPMAEQFERRIIPVDDDIVAHGASDGPQPAPTASISKGNSTSAQEKPATDDDRPLDYHSPASTRKRSRMPESASAAKRQHKCGKCGMIMSTLEEARSHYRLRHLRRGGRLPDLGRNVDEALEHYDASLDNNRRESSQMWAKRSSLPRSDNTECSTRQLRAKLHPPETACRAQSDKSLDWDELEAEIGRIGTSSGEISPSKRRSLEKDSSAIGRKSESPVGNNSPSSREHDADDEQSIESDNGNESPSDARRTVPLEHCRDIAAGCGDTLVAYCLTHLQTTTKMKRISKEDHVQILAWQKAVDAMQRKYAAQVASTSQQRMATRHVQTSSSSAAIRRTSPGASATRVRTKRFRALN